MLACNGRTLSLARHPLLDEEGQGAAHHRLCLHPERLVVLLPYDDAVDCFLLLKGHLQGCSAAIRVQGRGGTPWGLGFYAESTTLVGIHSYISYIQGDWILQ